ncbi:M20/M25/M40 family metallo-hydrolase [Sphingomonas alba]|uniref:M20/M25/M40 family metallo-hydrolase n=1 Tax=Sphingomonas alba TaxID=2908208 RepID=A0ABT0RLH8_9SPHN|nr:M20/M25/M40 family metallo-hydrolase [Sphingomonas alba]MCL6683317.1 M20/M25/M40 family metallo-hydrolase [Sphingomonas alba]
MHRLAVLVLALGTSALAAPATPGLTPAQRTATHDMFEHVINTPTVIGRHKVPDMAQYVADQFLAAGFPKDDVHVLPYHTSSATTGEDDTAALIVRWRAPGNSKLKPIMLMGHMDVVEAKREDSTTDPFVMTEQDGYYYGRGTTDMKDGIVGITQAMINLKAAGFKPKRDIVVLFTGDEETNGIGAKNGSSLWLDLLGQPEFGLNADGGGGSVNTDGSPAGFTMQAAEKTYAGYTLTVRNRGGHSSKPRKDNAIFTLAHALDKIEAYRFTPMLNETTRAYFDGRQKLEKGPLGDAMRAWLTNPNDTAAPDAIEASETEVGLTRTRCVPTRLFAGHADNALPQLATAMINCRIFPGVEPDAVKAELERIVANPEVVVTRNDEQKASLASPLRPDVVAAYTKAVHALHPGQPVFPEMSTGASDARPFRVAGIPIYGTNGGWTVTPIDNRAHGKDERLPVKSLYDNVVHWQILLRELAGK